MRNTDGNGQVSFTLSNDEVRFDRIRGHRFSFEGNVSSVSASDKTATLTGTGTWNGQSGYLFEVTVVDNALWGRLEDTIQVVIRGPAAEPAFTSYGPQLLKHGDPGRSRVCRKRKIARSASVLQREATIKALLQ